MTKTCFKCGVEKPVEQFYRHPMMADGRLGKCKDCARRDVRENRQRRLEYYRAYDRERGRRPGHVRWGALYPDRRKTHQAVARERRAGRLAAPPSCSRCGRTGRVEGHHSDYSQPLHLEWLCKPCHVLADRERRAREKAA